jgi:hypothetical protein
MSERLGQTRPDQRRHRPQSVGDGVYRAPKVYALSYGHHRLQQAHEESTNHLGDASKDETMQSRSLMRNNVPWSYVWANLD